MKNLGTKIHLSLSLFHAKLELKCYQRKIQNFKRIFSTQLTTVLITRNYLSACIPAPFLHREGKSGFVFYSFIISIFFPGTRPGHADEATGRIERYPGGGCVFAHVSQANFYLIPAVYGTISFIVMAPINRFQLGTKTLYGYIRILNFNFVWQVLKWIIV